MEKYTMNMSIRMNRFILGKFVNNYEKDYIKYY